MQKVTPDIAMEISQKCGRESYFAGSFWLVENCFYEEEDGSLFIYIQEPIDNELRLQFLPGKIPTHFAYNLEFAREDDIQVLQKSGVRIKEKIFFGHEYIYDRRKLALAEGPDLSKFRQNANYFRNHYSYRILQEYDMNLVKDFIRNWAVKKDLSQYSEIARKIFMWDLDLCLRYPDYSALPQKNIFVEVDGKLAGFAFTHPFTKNMFVGLMQKVDIRYRGLSNFLYQEKSKLYPDVPFFTIGTAAATPGLASFKDSMRPAEKIDTYLLKLNRS